MKPSDIPSSGRFLRGLFLPLLQVFSDWRAKTAYSIISSHQVVTVTVGTAGAAEQA